MSYPPNNYKEGKRMLENLGFIEIFGGKHCKFIHPTRKPKDFRIQPNFIMLSTDTSNKYFKIIIKQVEQFGFTAQEIKDAC